MKRKGKRFGLDREGLPVRKSTDRFTLMIYSLTLLSSCLLMVYLPIGSSIRMCISERGWGGPTHEEEKRYKLITI